MTSISNLEKAAKMFDDLKLLDAQALELEKMANLIANGIKTITFSLKATDGVNLDDQKTSPNSLLEYQMQWGLLDLIQSQRRPNNATQIDNEKRVDMEISDITALHCLGFMMQEVREKRDKLIVNLQKLGINI